MVCNLVPLEEMEELLRCKRTEGVDTVEPVWKSWVAAEPILLGETLLGHLAVVLD